MTKDLSGLKIDKSKKAPSRSRRRLFRGALALAALAAVLYLAFRFYPRPTASSDAAAEAQSPGAAAEEPAAPRDDRELLICSGYIVAHHKHELGSKVMGKVAWIGVEKGDRVRKGQLLVKLEDAEYRAQLEQAEASLGTARARLAELEAGSRPEEIERAEAELRRAETDRDNAAVELKRAETLANSGVSPQQLLDSARSRYEMAVAAVGVAEKNLELLRLGPRKEQIEQARSEVERMKAGVEYFRALLDGTEIRAPVDGTILQRVAEVGEMITTSFAGEMGAKSAVVVIADLSDLQVELDVSENDFRRISRDVECRMSPEAFPDRVYRCAIEEISPEADRQKASIQVKVKILEPDEYLRPEMSARVTFLKPEGNE